MTTHERPTPLSRDAVLREAVAMADESGSAAVSMRGLARRLGIEAMSLYHHVANKDAILDGMVDAVFAEVEIPSADGDWRAALRRRSVSMRTALRRHPWAIGLMESRRDPGAATLTQHDRTLACLRGGGFTVPGAGHAIAALDSYVYGFALQEVSLPFDTSGRSPDELAAVTTSIMDGLGESHPHLAEMGVHVLGSGYSFAAEFEVGLDLVLDGLERHLGSW